MKTGKSSLRKAADGMNGIEQTASTQAQSTRQLRPAQAKRETKSIHEALQEAREKAQERRDKLTLKKDSSQYSDAVMMAYAKLAQARNRAQTDCAAGYARRRMLQLRAALRTDQDNAPRIKAAIGQLQKAVGRASKKKRELQKEELLRIREKKARQEKLRRKATGLDQELNRRRTMRMIREEGYLREADIDNRQQEHMAKTRLELLQQAQAISQSVAPSLQTAVQGYAAVSNGTAVAGEPETAG